MNETNTDTHTHHSDMNKPLAIGEIVQMRLKTTCCGQEVLYHRVATISVQDDLGTRRSRYNTNVIRYKICNSVQKNDLKRKIILIKHQFEECNNTAMSDYEEGNQ